MTEFKQGDVVELTRNKFDANAGARFTVVGHPNGQSVRIPAVVTVRDDIGSRWYFFETDLKLISRKLDNESPMPEVGQIWRDTNGNEAVILWVGSSLLTAAIGRAEESFRVNAVRENWTRVEPKVLPEGWDSSNIGDKPFTFKTSSGTVLRIFPRSSVKAGSICLELSGENKFIVLDPKGLRDILDIIIEEN